MRRLLLLVAVVLASLLVAPAAHAITPSVDLDKIAESLQDDPVYLAPGAHSELSPDQADRLRKQITDGSEAIYIAVLPKSAKGKDSAALTLAYLQQRVSPGADLAVAEGKHMRATDTEAMVDAFLSKPDAGTYGLLSGYIRNIQEGVIYSDPDSASGKGSADLAYFIYGGVIIVIGVAALFLLGRWNRKRQGRARAEAVKAQLYDDITAFGEALDGVDSAAITAEADRADWTAALDEYDKAKRAAEDISGPADAGKVTSALGEGYYRIACVRARLAGEPAPARRQLCVFDPRHGMSVEDVSYRLSGHTPRDVPMCAVCAARVRRGEVPEIRMVTSGKHEKPYWDAGREYGGWAGGYYGWGLWSWGATDHTDVWSGTDLGSGLGDTDWGGGSFDSWDFGGGGDSGWDSGGGSWDFGGGDFGGGDSGGGD